MLNLVVKSQQDDSIKSGIVFGTCVVNFLSTFLTKRAAIPQQLYKTASHGLSATVKLLVIHTIIMTDRCNASPVELPDKNY